MPNNGRIRMRTEDLAAVMRPLAVATNLPGAVYTAPAVFKIEREELFGGMWTCVGRREDLPGTGDFLTVEVGGEPLLLVRGVDDALRGFYNVCQHRGACLVDAAAGRGARTFRCQYHAWTYGLRGELVAAPLMEERPGFDPAEHPLSPVRVECWEGFVFVNLSASAPSLAESMADFPDVSRYGVGSMRRAHRVVYDIAANWKLICENYSECYHCALAHPQLNRVSDFRSGGRSEFGTSYNGGPMRINEGFRTMSMSGESDLPEIDGLREADRCNIRYYNLYPSLLLALAPDYALVHLAWPLEPGRTRVVCDWLLPASTETEGFAGGEVVEFWDVTNRQDWQLCERVQAAVGSRGSRPGPYHPTEACVHAFDKWYVERLGDRLTDLAQ